MEKAEYGVLSLATPEGQPYGVPLSFCVARGAIYFHCALEGRKLEILSRNPSISFCVVGSTTILPAQFGTRFESAIVAGDAHEVRGAEKRLALEGLVRKYSGEFLNEGSAYIEANDARARVFKIAIQSISGKARR